MNFHMKTVINTWENIKTHQKITKMGPKVAPISTLGRPRGPPVIDLVFGHPFFMISGDLGNRFWLPFGSSFGVNFSTLFRDRSWSDLGTSSAGFGIKFGLILAPFWDSFGDPFEK